MINKKYFSGIALAALASLGALAADDSESAGKVGLSSATIQKMGDGQVLKYLYHCDRVDLYLYDKGAAYYNWETQGSNLDPAAANPAFPEKKAYRTRDRSALPNGGAFGTLEFLVSDALLQGAEKGELLARYQTSKKPPILYPCVKAPVAP